jgi:hypothetical protein
MSMKTKKVRDDQTVAPTIALVEGDNRNLSDVERNQLRTIGAVIHGAAAADKHAEITSARVYDEMHENEVHSSEYLAPVKEDYPMGKDDPMFEQDYRFFQSKQLEVAIGAAEDRNVYLEGMRSRDPEGGWEPMPSVIMKDLPKLLFQLKTADQLTKAGYAPIVHTHMEAIKAAMRKGMKRIREGLETREANAEQEELDPEIVIEGKIAKHLVAIYKLIMSKENATGQREQIAGTRKLAETCKVTEIYDPVIESL